MSYLDFLGARRQLIAQVIRSRWDHLRVSTTAPTTRETADVAPAFAHQPEHWSVEQLLTRKESDRVEFKSSARWNYHRAQTGKEIQDAITKTVAAFMNTTGGTLIIGVDDERSVLGLNKDLATVKNHNLDGFDLWLHQHLNHTIGTAEVVSLVSVAFVETDGYDLCRVDVKASSGPVFATTSGNDTALFVRTGAAMNMLTAKETHAYINQHWPRPGPGAAKASNQSPQTHPNDGRLQETSAKQDENADGPRTGPRQEPDHRADLESQFHPAVVSVYERAKSEASYNASQFIQMVSELGGFETARILLASSDVSDGFTALWEARRLDLTVEALVLGAQWTGLFTAEERHTAEDRLRQYEYKND